MSITIAIPFYNPGEHFLLAIKSVLSQTHKDFELLLIDDGSTDDSLKTAKSFIDQRITVVSDGKNLGLPTRLNQVTKLAKFDLIARMDADDIIPKDRLEKQFYYMVSNQDIDLVGMGMTYFDNKKYFGHVIPSANKELNLSHMINGTSGIFHATLLVRKSWYQRNLYDVNAVRIEDYELWLRAFKNNDLKVGFIDEVGYYYRSDNTLTLSKYVSVYKSFIRLSLGRLPFHSLNFKMFFRYISKFLLILLIFQFKQEGKYLSQKSRFDYSNLEKDSFEQSLFEINREQL